MKKLLFFSAAAISFFSFTAHAQKLTSANVPEAVKAAFVKDFPGITTKWEKENTSYEASFKQNGNTMSALYDAMGNKTETEMDIKISQLPSAVLTYVTGHYKKEKIKEAAIITKANGEVNYEAEVKGMDLLFTKEGKFISTAKD
jgi:Putative beta-lactamase-inhibitor-like, PepSY-like